MSISYTVAADAAYTIIDLPTNKRKVICILGFDKDGNEIDVEVYADTITQFDDYGDAFLHACKHKRRQENSNV